MDKQINHDKLRDESKTRTQKVLKVCQINGFIGFSSFFSAHTLLLMVMFDVKGKWGSEFKRESGGRLGPRGSWVRLLG